jgi:hypothetical protein
MSSRTCRFGGAILWDPSAGLPPSLCQGEAPLGELTSWPRLLRGPLLLRLGSRLLLRLFASLPAPANPPTPSAMAWQGGDPWTNPSFGSRHRHASQCSSGPPSEARAKLPLVGRNINCLQRCSAAKLRLLLTDWHVCGHNRSDCAARKDGHAEGSNPTIMNVDAKVSHLNRPSCYWSSR